MPLALQTPLLAEGVTVRRETAGAQTWDSGPCESTSPACDFVWECHVSSLNRSTCHAVAAGRSKKDCEPGIAWSFDSFSVKYVFLCE